jgi:hypothetical protein
MIFQCKVQVLNALEGTQAADARAWTCSPMTDTGPLLRLEDASSPLTKKERYGHPMQRRLVSSFIPESLLLSVVLSFFRYGLDGVLPRTGGWTWRDVHALNKRIDWSAWQWPCGS